MRRPTRDDYENLLAFRARLRRFLYWSQAKAREVDMTPAQHQLLLAIKGHPGARGRAVGDLAGYLLLRYHSTVGLTDRAERPGWCSDATMTTTAASPGSGAPPTASSA